MDEAKPPLDAEAIYARRKRIIETTPRKPPKPLDIWLPDGNTVGETWLDKIFPDGTRRMTGYKQGIISGYPQNLRVINLVIRDYRETQNIGKAEDQKLKHIEQWVSRFSKRVTEAGGADQIQSFQLRLNDALLDHLNSRSGTRRANKKNNSDEFRADTEKRKVRDDKLYELREKDVSASDIARRSDMTIILKSGTTTRLTVDSVRRIYREIKKAKEKPT